MGNDNRIFAYKMLIDALGEFTQNLPMTGIAKYLDKAIANGMKIIPTDMHAINIITNCMFEDTPNGSVQQFLNLRFGDLPYSLRPFYKNEADKIELAYWCRNSATSDRVTALVDFEGDGGSGFWCDVKGNKVALIMPTSVV